MPWRNGAGETRELAVATDDTGEVVWRISLATLTGVVDFSTFPALDRLFVALGPLRLTVDGETTALRAGDQIRFAGEAHVTVSLDAPTHALNVMTRRGVAQADVVLRDTVGVRGRPTVTVDLEDRYVDVFLRCRPQWDSQEP